MFYVKLVLIRFNLQWATIPPIYQELIIDLLAHIMCRLLGS